MLAAALARLQLVRRSKGIKAYRTNVGRKGCAYDVVVGSDGSSPSSFSMRSAQPRRAYGRLVAARVLAALATTVRDAQLRRASGRLVAARVLAALATSVHHNIYSSRCYAGFPPRFDV